ncbi:ACT domain-containing protein [Vibrio cholerae]|nr:ACT domain-containing protein [Vibrio cholerae]EGR4173554.1 ACT domain-containing protein [Vibrio cholerae]EJK2100044.1 ACT domain-containing protein [Vibrio cholerae]EKF9606890.1 ACT domain-containing protein [Vibrio cholerae]
MSGIKSLELLLQSMSPELMAGDYVFCTVNGALSDYLSLEPIATFREPEGLTLVLEAEKTQQAGIESSVLFSLITLTVHSSLEAVGLTAAFATKLAEHGISANVIAGYYHDHIFVQKEKAQQALQALGEFAQA